VHAHTAIAVAIAGACWVAWEAVAARRADREVRRLALVAAIAGGTGLVVGAREVLRLSAGAGGFLTWFPGWIGESREAFAGGSIGRALLFWLLNAGALLVLVPLALRRDARLRRFYLPFAGVWLLGFLVRTQPWEWDNNNYFVWWQAGSVIVAAPLLASWLGGGRLSRAAALASTAALCLGGALTFIFAAEHRMHLWSPGDQRFASEVREATPPDAVILTSNGHTHPVSGLAGRQVVMGFPGWLLTRGMDWARYEDDVTSMLSGDVARMRRLGVDYVVMGPWEESFAREKGFQLAEAFGDRRRFEVVLDEIFDGRRWLLLRRIR
jgi:hypothetical protein